MCALFLCSSKRRRDRRLPPVPEKNVEKGYSAWTGKGCTPCHRRVAAAFCVLASRGVVPDGAGRRAPLLSGRVFPDEMGEGNRGRLRSIATVCRLRRCCLGGLAVRQARQKRCGAVQIASMPRRGKNRFLEFLSNINELYIIGLLTIVGKSAIFISEVSTQAKRVLTTPEEGVWSWEYPIAN